MNRRARQIILSFLVLLTLMPIAVAQRRGERFRIDGERIKSYVEWLSRDELEGRRSGTEGYRRAAEWVAGKYKEWGLQPAGENGTYFQEVPLRGFTWNVGVPEMNISGRQFYLPDGDFTLGTTSTAATSVNAEIVFVGHGISAADKGLDEYAKVDVAGKVVLVLKGNPHDAPPPGGGRFAPGESRQPDLPADFTAESTDQFKIRTAYDKKAAAILLYDAGGQSSAGAARGRRSPGTSQGALNLDRNFLTFTIQDAAFQYIMRANDQETNDGLTRRIGAYRRAVKKGNSCSMKTGKMAFLKGYDQIIEYNQENENNTAPNVIAQIEGTDPRLKEEIVVVGGHLDHLGMRDGIVYNGADDDASGSAVTMEVARVLREGGFQPKRTVLFCCWCGEEMGLVGSTYFVNNPYGDVSVAKVVTYLNMDMVGLGDILVAPGALDYPSIWEVIKRDQDADIMTLVRPGVTERMSSDHAAFIRQGIEALALQTREGVGHLDYHRPEDDAWKIQPEALRMTGEFVIQAAINLANETEVELIIPNRKEIYQAKSQAPPAITNFNPELAGSVWSYVQIEARDKDDLQSLLLEKAWERISASRTPPPAARPPLRAPAPARTQRPVARGLDGPNLKLFEGDVKLLVMASDLLGFGRIDFKADEFTEGQISIEGRQAFKTLEDNNITLHLIDPTEAVIDSMLTAATRPFIITGTYTIHEDMFDRINEKGVLLGINFDPKNVADCIERLENAKECLGDTDNLVIFLTATEGLDDAAQKLYDGLKQAHWPDEEIIGRRGRGGVFGGNLGILQEN